MELFLDSVNFDEIEEAIKMGTLTGLTTTPTFMFRHGITDIDGAIVKLSGMIPSLHIEALGNNSDEIKGEVERIMKLPLKKKPVFKIPVSNHGISERLVISERTVRTHMGSILSKLHLANRTQAALYALREGLATLEEGPED